MIKNPWQSADNRYLLSMLDELPDG